MLMEVIEMASHSPSPSGKSYKRTSYSIKGNSWQQLRYRLPLHLVPLAPGQIVVLELTTGVVGPAPEEGAEVAVALTPGITILTLTLILIPYWTTAQVVVDVAQGAAQLAPLAVPVEAEALEAAAGVGEGVGVPLPPKMATLYTHKELV